MEILSLGGNSLSGPVTPNGAWDDQTPLSAWQGVTVTSGRVTDVDLSGLGLAGPPAPQIGALDALERLDASANALTGPIPAELASLAALEVLDLSSNALTGAVPPQLGSLAGLEVLDLSLNTLNGPIPSQLGNLASVEVLDLAGNDLTGAIPVELGSLTGLRVLRITGPGLTGPIPTQLGALSGLTELLIDGGQLSGPIPVELAALTSLESLHIAGGQLSGTIPAQLADLSTLDSLYISAPNLTGTLPPELADLAGLQTLWIKSQSLTGTIPARYASLTGLRTLYLSGGGLTGPVPVWITSLSGIERLYLHNNSLDGPVPANLAQLNALSTLWLAGNTLTGTIPPQLADIAALQTLDLRDNPLTWPPPAALADPRQGLTAILPDATWWAPPRPEDPAAQPGDTELTIAWQHPGAGSDYHIDHYSINYRPQNHTGAFAQTTADASPATISGLTNGTTYDIFVTATNTRGTSAPSVTVAAAPLMSAAQTAGFNDVHPSNVHAGDIARLEGWGIFDGTNCGPDMFCPDDPLQRIRLAVWLVRALDRGRHVSAPPVAFTDVSATHPWKHYVDRLYQLNVTRGCSATPLKFCPNDPVDRAQMAVFLQRAFTIPNANPAGFTDVPTTHYAYNAINAIYAANITLGCSDTPLKYCPNNPTTHAQMATFISRACNYAGPCDPISPIVVTPTGPPAPTITKITPGPGTLTITWEPDTSSPPGTRPAATSWKIHYRRFIETTNPQGALTTQYFTPAEPVPVPGPAIPSATHILQGLEFDAHYAIKIQGLAGTTPGSFSPETNTKTDPAAVRLVALEITQGLQNWNGDITLVKGKRTVVRAFLEPRSGSEAHVDVRLQAVVNGRVVATAAPRNPDVQKVPPIEYNEYLFTARDGAAADRALLGASVNFLLDLDVPGTSDEWVGSPSGQPNLSPTGALHSVTYRLAVADGVVCSAAAAQTDSSADPGTACKADLEFRFVKTPEVRLVGITADGMQPTRGDLDEQAQRILSMMPIPQLDYDLRQLNHVYPATPMLDPVLTRLLLTRATDASNRVYLGVLLGGGGGLAFRPGNAAAWYTSGTEGKEEFGYARNRGAHEFGHTVGRRHTLDKNDKVVCGDGNAEDPGSVYPYIEKIGAEYRALLGPSSSSDDERVWGFDTRFVKPRSASTPEINQLAVINPEEVFALMSYCGNPGNTTQERWVDRFYHGLFITRINGINWGLGPLPGPEGTVDPLESTHTMFSGHTTVAADGSSSEAVLLPVLEVSAAVGAPEPSVGGYVLELLDGAGAVLHAVRFDAQVVAADASGGGSGDGFEVWAVSVPGAPDFESVRVRRSSPSGQMAAVAQAARSASAPAVSITGPTAGQVLSGETVQFSWTGADPDGDALVYLVQYSTDGGATYETLATDHRAMSLGVPRETLAGSSTARVRVVASDGLRTATAVSALFAVAANAPQVRIDSPAEAARFGGRQPLALQASAYDSEDGVLASSAISWSSDLDGPLGTGAHLVIDSGGLTAGTHTFTATATDSSNMAASASVTVTVDSHNQPPTATDDTAHVRPGASLVIDVAANDTDPEGDINHATLAVAVPAATGRAGTRHGRVAYTADIDGYDVFVYEICDRANQCTTAEVTVIAPNGQ